MSIALFDEPPRVTIKYPDAAGGSRVGLLLGFVKTPGVEGIVCREDGSVVLLDRAHFTIDWRYSPETDRWADADAQPSDQEG